MADLDWLHAHDFRAIGEGATTTSLVHKVAWLRRQPGLYAFVVGGEVRLIGKATRLHSRLRNYSRRSFGDTKVALRRVHEGIRDAVAAGRTVVVYVRPFDPASAETLDAQEAALIAEARPTWNVSLVPVMA